MKPAERTLADVLEEDDEFEEFEQEHWGKAQEEEGDAKQWQDNWGRFFINLKLQKLADTCIKKATHIYLSIFSTLFHLYSLCLALVYNQLRPFQNLKRRLNTFQNFYR